MNSPRVRLNPEKLELLSVIFVEGKLNVNFILASIKLPRSECTRVELLAMLVGKNFTKNIKLQRMGFLQHLIQC